MNCENCGSSTNKKKLRHGKKHIFCSNFCSNQYRHRQAINNKVKTRCQNCGTPTDNPKFCSRRCAAALSNKRNPKRKLGGICPFCGNPIHVHKRCCNKCGATWKLLGGIITTTKIYQDSTTLREIFERQRNKYRSGGMIHKHARDKIAHITSCQRCGYDKHVEASHIKAVSKFSPDSTLGEVNAISNLVALCPNCHWEFDTGLFSL